MIRKLTVVALTLTFLVFSGCSTVKKIFGPTTKTFRIVVSVEVPHNQLVMINGIDQELPLTPIKTSREYRVEIRTRRQSSYYNSYYGYYPYIADVTVQLLDVDTGIPSVTKQKIAYNDRITLFAFDASDFRH